MNSSFETIALTLLRTTLVTSLAAVAALSLLWLLRIQKAKTHRLVWLLVIAQGWLLWPYTWRMEVHRPRGTSVVAAPSQLPYSPTVATYNTVEASAPQTTPFDWPALVANSSIATWCLGAALLVLIGLVRYTRLFAGGWPGEVVTDREWLAEWNEVQSKRGSKHRTELRTTRNTGPLVCWVPWVLLVLVPKSLWASLARGERLAILRHELAHCERGDLWKNLAVRLLALPQWFNPLVWLAVRRFEEAGEWACDEQVAQSSTDSATDYARVLLCVADYTTHVPCGAAGMASGVLSRRVKRLLHLPNKEVREMRGFILPVLLVAVGLFQAVRIERVAADEPAAAPAVTPTPSEATHETVRNEWTKQPLPPYVVEPPDILLIDAMKLVPKTPHKIEPFDGLLIRAHGVDEQHAIPNAYFVDPDGNIDLGPKYGKIHVAGVWLEKADEVVREHLAEKYPEAKTSVSLATAGGVQQVIGEHLVGPDGRVNLGSYGSVYVTGMTLPEAKRAVEKHLSKHLVDPEVIVDVFSYNSKKYYIITQGESGGDNIVTAPITGNDTVLDAIAAIGGLRDAWTAKIFIARPAPQGGAEQILPVDFDAIARGKSTSTNYQLLPGDRLFIEYPREAKPDSPAEASPQPDPADRYSLPAPPEEVKRDQIPTLVRNSAGYYQRVGVGVNSEAGVVGKIELDQKKPAEEPQMVSATVCLFTDPKQNLRSIEGLRNGSLVTGDTQVLEGMLDMLLKNDLTEVLARRTVKAGVGQEARIDQGPMLLGEGLHRYEFYGNLATRQNGESTIFELRFNFKQYSQTHGLDTAFELSKGQSILFRFPQRDESVPDDLYLMVSREAAK